MNYPSIEEVEAADRMQLARWYRFLPIPTQEGYFPVMDMIVKRFREMGGWTPEISKAIGWGDDRS